MLLEGKVALVTGGGRGMGRATALRFAKEGARVVVCDIGADVSGQGEDGAVAEAVGKEIRDAGGEAVCVAQSVATRGGARRAVEAALDAYGALDVVVSSAGLQADEPILSVSEDSWRRTFEVLVDGTLFLTQAAAERMKRSGGRIVNTTALSGLLGGFGQAAYSAANGAVYALTRTSAIELQRFGIRVNAVAPLAKTRLTRDLPIFEHVETMQPEHVAPAHLFFASDLSRDLTGHVLAVAGGRVSTYRLVESTAKLKEDAGGVWTPEELQEHWTTITK